jgi:NAD(P)-dependent dehydrogenase (short-subunit alcohol dehydrogenase family)
MDRFRISSRTVLITGPARGIGAETARQLARRGANLSLVGLEPERLEVLARELGPRAAWFDADVRDREALQRAVDGTVERFGGIDVVVANAGIAPVGTVREIDPADFEAVIDVNLLGVWRTVRAALPHVVERDGYVLSIASLAAFVHLPLIAAYSAAKAGVHAFSDSLRMELRGTGTKVGAAYFGFIDTDMTRQGVSDAEANPSSRRVPDRFRPRLIPVPTAGRAIVRGIERRARLIVVPRSGYAAMLAPALAQRLAEGTARFVM